MHTWLVLLILVTFTLFGIEDAEAAQSQFVKGTATVPLKGKCRKDVPRDNKIFQAAFTQAKLKPYGLIQAVSAERSKIRTRWWLMKLK